ncbi:MAG: hypothetical protein NTZ47_13185 [Bacteroidetes bacterium]|nr:hypothetical protein [Bacteroidota bacterium]
MQQLLYKYLILHNRLNIPSLGSFTVSYSPAQYNAQDGTLLPKQPVLHFKDGPPAISDTSLLPFLAAELKISSSVAANELLNFSLQLMTEMVEHKRAHLKGMGTLTKDSSGQLHFNQEQSSVQLQPAVATREVNPLTAPSAVQPAATSAPINPPVYRESAPIPAASSPQMPAPKPAVTATKKVLPEGNLDPTLDYAGIQNYQDSPELMKVRQQLAQRREQVNSEFDDLRAAKERMKRVPLPGKEGDWNSGSSAGSSLRQAPSTGSLTPSSPPLPTRNTLPSRRPNPLLGNDANKGIGKTDYPPITPSLSSASNTLANLPIDVPKRTVTPRENTPLPDVTGKWTPSPRPVKPFSTEGDTGTPSDPLTVRMPKRTWQAPEKKPDSTGFTGNRALTPMPTIGKQGKTSGTPLFKEQQPLRAKPTAQEEPEEATAKKWPWQKREKSTVESFSLPVRFAEEEEEPRPGLLARLKSSITGIFSRNKNIPTTIVEEEDPQLSENTLGGIIAKASTKLVEMKNSELDTSGEPKKDYWWVYSIFMAFAATVALIIHMF